MKIAYTISSANYLPFAKALADSVIKHNGDYKFIIVLADTYKDYEKEFFAPHQVVSVLHMNISPLEEMNSRYNLFELSCALKPYVAEYLLYTFTDCSQLYYFDADILVFHSLTRAEKLLEDHCLVLTPHVAKPLAYDESIFTELNVLRTGVYNAGFFGINRSKESFEFLDWWKKRLQYHCFNDAGHGLFVDQLWLTLAPVYFRSTCLLFDPGYNLAYWNFLERSISVQDGNYLVDGSPLVFFHYSGYDIFQPELISRHQKQHSFATSPQYRPLFDRYKELVLQNNKNDLLSLPATLGKLQVPVAEVPAREKNFFKRKFRKIFKKR